MQDITQITLKSESGYDFCLFTPYKNQTEKYPDQLYITKCIQHEPTALLKLRPQALAYYFAVRKIIQNNIKIVPTMDSTTLNQPAAFSLVSALLFQTLTSVAFPRISVSFSVSLPGV